MFKYKNLYIERKFSLRWFRNRKLFDCTVQKLSKEKNLFFNILLFFTIFRVSVNSELCNMISYHTVIILINIQKKTPFFYIIKCYNMYSHHFLCWMFLLYYKHSQIQKTRFIYEKWISIISKCIIIVYIILIIICKSKKNIWQ